MPVLEVLHWHLGRGAVDTGIKNGNIEIAPFETMRGRSFRDAFVILDEAQNVTPHEIKMFLTRVGENCKVILNGDVFQSDLQETSGLSKAIHMVKKYMLPVPVIEFEMQHIVRSDLCKQWISAFMQEEKVRG
jgi:phosphate starvation-inducible PhoH-like protein